MVGMPEAGREERALGDIRYLKEEPGPDCMWAKPCSQVNTSGYLAGTAWCAPGSGADSKREVVLQLYCEHV